MNRAAAPHVVGAVCLGGFALLGRAVSQPGVAPIDAATTASLHALASPTLDPLMRAATFVGSTPVLATLVAFAVLLLLVRRRRAEAGFLVAAFVGALVLNDALKWVFHRPRPGFGWADAWPETSFPSGHSMSSLVVYVALALVVWRLQGPRSGRIAVVLATVVTLAVGISRIYLGAHWLSDVVGGYLAGALWLGALAVPWMPGSRVGRRDATRGERDPRTTGAGTRV